MIYGCSQPRELWFIDLIMYMYIYMYILQFGMCNDVYTCVVYSVGLFSQFWAYHYYVCTYMYVVHVYVLCMCVVMLYREQLRREKRRYRSGRHLELSANPRSLNQK